MLTNEYPCTTCPDCAEMIVRDCVATALATGYPLARVIAQKQTGAIVEGVADGGGMITIPDGFAEGANFFSKWSGPITIMAYPDINANPATCWIIKVQ